MISTSLYLICLQFTSRLSDPKSNSSEVSKSILRFFDRIRESAKVLINDSRVSNPIDYILFSFDVLIFMKSEGCRIFAFCSD